MKTTETYHPSVKAGVLSFGFNNGINVFEDKRNQQILRPALDSGDVERQKKLWVYLFMALMVKILFYVCVE